MAQKPGMFYAASRIYTFPVSDLSLIAPNALEQATANTNPLQLSSEGDWAIYGFNAVKFTGPAGALPSNSPINFNVQTQKNNAFWFRQGNQRAVSSVPLEHGAGKCGFPGLSTYPKTAAKSSRLYPYFKYTGAQPTEKSPVRLVMHTVLIPPGLDVNSVVIGSKAEMLQKWGGFYVYYTGTMNLTAAEPLVPGQTATIELPIHGEKMFFVDQLFCRQTNATFGPNSVDNPLTDELPLLVDVRDTTALAGWNAPDFAPLWSMFGSRAYAPYVPPTCFVVQTLGNIEVNLKNAGTTNLEDKMEFTFGGLMVDVPKADIANMRIG